MHKRTRATVFSCQRRVVGRALSLTAFLLAAALTVAAAQPVAAWPDARLVAMADLNGDGQVELIFERRKLSYLAEGAPCACAKPGAALMASLATGGPEVSARQLSAVDPTTHRETVFGDYELAVKANSEKSSGRESRPTRPVFVDVNADAAPELVALNRITGQWTGLSLDRDGNATIRALPRGWKLDLP